ncbi:MAG: dephospho-CoA kinase [Acidobacteriota bacterium]|jgi:dephospho-CoA kinase|nr:dephospho-CoA kinase [Acidobacteriota bacterium]
MPHVGLTGNIAVGKSCASAHFARLGAFVIDADRVAHGLFERGAPTYRRVVEAFGEGVLGEDGEIDRRRLGDIVFASEEKRLLLNGIAHPAVRDAIAGKVAARDAVAPGGVVIIDAALLVETGGYRRYDRLIVVACGAEQQLGRLMARDRLSEAAARSRIAAQMPMEEKVRFADYVIDTSGTFDATRAQVEAVYRELLQIGAGCDLSGRGR